MQTLDSVTCSDNYAATAQILDVFNSNGGYFVVTGNDVFMQLQYGGYGQTFETREVHVPVGNGVLQPGTTGIKFRNYVAGSNAIVSAALSEEAEPSIVLTAGGQATPTPAPVVQLAYAEKTSNTSITSATTGDVIATCPAITLDGTTAIEVICFAPNVSRGTTFIQLGYSDGTGGNIVAVANNANAGGVGASGGRVYTPIAGSYTFSLRAIVDAGTGTVSAGSGSAGNFTPAYIRILEA